MERTRAEFRMQREALGLSQRDFAALLGVRDRSVRRWELDGSMPPDDAWKLLDELRADYKLRVASHIASFADVVAEAGRPPKTVSIPYFRTQGEYDAVKDDGQPVGYVNAVLRDVAQQLRAKGFNVAVRFQDE